MTTNVESELQRWVTAQLLFWEGQRLAARSYNEHLRRFNDFDNHTFVFLIRDQSVSLMPKPKHYAIEELNSEGNNHLVRAHLYRRFFQDVLRESSLNIECQIGMSVHDRPPSTVFPLFAFQKPRGSNVILLPDIDAIGQDYYVREQDKLFYSDKINKAVFVGSTTGTTHTLQSVQDLLNERLKLGISFRNDPNVIFKLPNVVQCDSLETENAIRALGFGTGSLSWREQLNYRFLISVDGNGATCSRVAIALKSNSVLLKFDSDNLLYYFDGLGAYRDYIPVKSPKDVRAILTAERRNPGACEAIAKGGAAFFENYLKRTPTLRYTALLLQRYAAMFSYKEDFAIPRGKCIAHFSGVGDVIYDLVGWIGEPDSQLAMEGFEISFTSGLTNDALICRFLVEHGGDWTTVSRGDFVGARGRFAALVGLAFDLEGDASMQFDLEYRCASVDGVISDVHRRGESCQCNGAPLSAFRITLSTRTLGHKRNHSDSPEK